jgi:hypothetical protein
MPFTDTSAVEKVVYNVVINWLADQQNASDQEIQNNLDWTLSGTPPNGYNMQPQAYTKMCNEISTQIQKTLGRAVNLGVPWRNKHKNDSVNAFIAAVTIEIVNAKLTNIGKGAVTWSMAKQQAHIT